MTPTCLHPAAPTSSNELDWQAPSDTTVFFAQTRQRHDSPSPWTPSTQPAMPSRCLRGSSGSIRRRRSARPAPDATAMQRRRRRQSPHVALVVPCIGQSLHPGLRFLGAAPLLPGHQLQQRPVHVARHVLGVAAHVQAAAVSVQVLPHLVCGVQSCGRVSALPASSPKDALLFEASSRAAALADNRSFRVASS